MSTTAEEPQETKAAEGRKKIKIARIADARSRQVTFLKRKNGLLKKAMELGILCDCEVTVIIFNVNNGKLFEYSSVPIEKALQRYATYSGPTERRKTEKFFDLAASKGNTNIPLHEPTLAQAALDAATAATHRPRPFHKFNQNAPSDARINGKRLSSGETPPAVINPSDRNPFARTSDMPVDLAEQRPTKFPKPETLVNAPHAVPYPIAVYSQSQTHSQTLSQSHSQAYSLAHSQSPHSQPQPHLLPPPAPVHLSHPPPAMARPPLAGIVVPRFMPAIPFQPNIVPGAIATGLAVVSPASGSLSAFLGLSSMASKDSDGPVNEMKEKKSTQSAARELEISKTLSQSPLQMQTMMQSGDAVVNTPSMQHYTSAMALPDGSQSAPLGQGEQPQLTLSMFATAQASIPQPTSLSRPAMADDSTLPPPWTMNDAEAPPAAMLACRSESSHGIVAGMTGLVDSEAEGGDYKVESVVTGKERTAMLRSEAVAVSRMHGEALNATEGEVAVPAVIPIPSGDSKCEPVEVIPAQNLNMSESPNGQKSLNMVEPLPSISRDDILKDEILDTTPSGLHSMVTPNSGDENMAFPATISLSRLPSNISGTGSMTGGPPWTSWVNQIFPLVPNSNSKGGEQLEVTKAKEQARSSMDGAVSDATDNEAVSVQIATTPAGATANARDSMVEPLATCIDAMDTTGPEALPSFMETDLALSRAGSNDSSSGVAPLIMRTLSNMQLQSLTSRGMSFETLLSAPPTVRSADGDEIMTTTEVAADEKKPLV